MQNRFNFVERFAPLSSLQGCVVEFDNGKFIVAPEGMISYNLQDDHAVVWYQNEGEDYPRFAQMGEFVSYQQVATAILPIGLPWVQQCPRICLRCWKAPQKRFWWPTPPGPGTSTLNATQASAKPGGG